MIRAPGLVPGGFFIWRITHPGPAREATFSCSERSLRIWLCARCGSRKACTQACASCERPSIQYARLRRPQRVPAKGTAGLRSARSVRAGAIVVALRPCRIRTPQSHEGTVRPGGRQACAAYASEIPVKTFSTSSPSGMSFDDDMTHGRANSVGRRRPTAVCKS